MLSWDIVLGRFLKRLCDSVGNSYCESDYSKGEVNVVKITHIRLQKKKRRRRMLLGQVFIIWLVRFGKKTFYVLMRSEKMPGLHFLSGIHPMQS